jgi:hypothetical protein
MKRLLLATLFAGGALSVTFLLRPAPLVGQAPPSAVAGAPCCKAEICKEMACCSLAKKTKDDAAVVAELVKILEETKSSDTFVATLVALGQFEDKSPLPAVVRNAARLGLLKGMCKESEPTHPQAMILDYLSGELTAECRHGDRPNGAPVPPGYYPPCAPPVPVTYMSQPFPQVSTFAPAPPPPPAVNVLRMTVPCLPAPAPAPEHIAAPKACTPTSAAPATKDSENAQNFSFWTGFSR